MRNLQSLPSPSGTREPGVAHRVGSGSKFPMNPLQGLVQADPDEALPVSVGTRDLVAVHPTVVPPEEAPWALQ